MACDSSKWQRTNERIVSFEDEVLPTHEPRLVLYSLSMAFKIVCCGTNKRIESRIEARYYNRVYLLY